jgi:hypothetical protein
MLRNSRCNPSAIPLCLIALSFATESVAATLTIPMPRERPKIAPSVQSPAPVTGGASSLCQLRLGKIGVFEPLPPITGPGECLATDVVKIDAILLPDKHRVLFSPPATLRCPMAEAVAQWITEDVAPAVGALGASLRRIDDLESFDCRPRNGITGAQISEHGRANALDLRSFTLENGKVIELNNANASKSLRERLRDSACARFSTVLGNGADAYHETHVHIDLKERSNHYKICQWDILDHAETVALAAKNVATAAAASIRAPMTEPDTASLAGSQPAANTQSINLPRHREPPVALSQAALLSRSAMARGEGETVAVGQWTIATSYKDDKFDDCSMSRSTDRLDITFLRTADGLLLVLGSEKWKLERGKAYDVHLAAGSRSVKAKALAEAKAVKVPLADRSLIKRVQTSEFLEVRGEGATVRVPLDGSAAALTRLESCFNKNNQTSVESNPFVAPSRRP